MTKVFTYADALQTLRKGGIIKQKATEDYRRASPTNPNLIETSYDMINWSSTGKSVESFLSCAEDSYTLVTIVDERLSKIAILRKTLSKLEKEFPDTIESIQETISLLEKQIREKHTKKFFTENNVYTLEGFAFQDDLLKAVCPLLFRKQDEGYTVQEIEKVTKNVIENILNQISEKQ